MPSPLISKNQILTTLTLVIGMFMAILDIQIVASSLSEIGAGLSASSDELSWIQTSYLIAEVIIIPATGFLTKALSTRIFYFISALGFTLMSIFCSLAWSIESMIIARALQGLFGGAMIPAAFSSVLIIFPKSLHATMGVVIGLVVTVAPTIGPTLGGYITEISSWHYMFLINVVPGFFVCIGCLRYIDFDKPNHTLLANFDAIGAALMAFSLGSFQYILEEGNHKGWFDDSFILILSISVIICSSIFIWRQLSYPNPIIDITVFRNINFSLGCIYSFILGTGLYGTVYLLPLFLFQIAGYNTYQIGICMIVTGVFQLFSAPLAGYMFEKKYDKRLILAIGFIVFAFGCYLNSFLTNESKYWQFFIPQAVRGIALMFCFMPINDLALGTINKIDLPNASGIYNLMRNLGGAIGLAYINNIISNNTEIAASILAENINITNNTAMAQINNLNQFLTGQVASPNLATMQIINNLIEREAFIIAINQAFVIISLLFILGTFLLPFTSNIKAK